MAAEATRTAFLGFGEAAAAFVEGWGSLAPAHGLTAYDIKTDAAETRAGKRAEYQRWGVAGAETAADAVRGAQLVLSTVTADQALDKEADVARREHTGACVSVGAAQPLADRPEEAVLPPVLGG